jgi:lipoprotein-anchoring transpeptidase ErfK/SrfK
MFLLAALALSCALAMAPPARADRFGPPWQAEVTAEHTVVYTEPDRGAPPVGPLGKGQIAIVLAERQGTDGEWTRIPDGFIPSADLAEKRDPWVAEVAVPSVSVRAKPNAQDDVRRTAQQGALLRVTGVSPGLDGDTSIWWSTTEGYVPLDALKSPEPDHPWAQQWTLPAADEAPNGWWGQIARGANVRAAPTTEAAIVGEFAGGERVKVLAEEEGEDVGGNNTWYRIDGGRFAGARVHSSLVRRIADPRPNTAPPPNGAQADQAAWIVVDRQAKTLTLMRDGQPQFTTYVALGQAGVDTPPGGYGIIVKYRADDMTSTSVPDATRSYDLPNVPSAQYYKDGGFAIHGTYWHDAFGTDQSQGCVNLTWADGLWLFEQTQPQVPAGTNAQSAAQGGSTPVVITG